MIIESLNVSSANKLLPQRDAYGNKGTFGKVLLICGSKNMVGCCVLATNGALRSGAGLVTLAFPDVLYNALASRLTENLFLPLETDSKGFIKHTCVPAILDAAEKADVIMVGCGIGTGYAQKLIVSSLLQIKDTPVIFDADALNCISDCTDILKKSQANVLLTPHPGEMARLTGKSIFEIESDRQKTVIDFCAEYNVNLLLKGHETLICNSHASELYVNTTGNTGLSKGGSGDLLSGIIAGLAYPMNCDLFKAAALGAFIHGMSADILKNDYSEYSILPTDCMNALPKVFSIIEKGYMN